MINDTPLSTIVNEKTDENDIDSTRNIKPKEIQKPKPRNLISSDACCSYNFSSKTSHMTNSQDDIDKSSGPKTHCPHDYHINFNNNELHNDYISPKSTLNDETDALHDSYQSSSYPQKMNLVINNTSKVPIPNENMQELLNKTIAEQYSCDRKSIISFKEVWKYFSSMITIDKDNNKDLIIVEDFKFKNCFQRLLIQCNSNYQILPSLKDERHIIFSIAKIGFDKNNIHHQNLIESIYKFLLQQSEPKEYNWELIGFQDEPQKDLRSVGMFGLIQILALIDHYPIYSHELFTYLGSIQSEWIFAILLLNITKLTLDLLKSGVLIIYCNQSKNILEIINNFYCGVIYHISKELLSQNDTLINVTNKLTADFLASLMTQVKDFAQKNPGHFLWNASQLSKQYPTLIISNTQSKSNELPI